MSKKLYNVLIIVLIPTIFIIYCCLFTKVIDGINPVPTSTPTVEPSLTPIPYIAPAPIQPSYPIGATALCRDGTYIYSSNRRGTCSHHGGVAVWLR